jgi:translation initiation factor 2B subunit (eIF-2B alpha/beta/delta family)
MDNEEKIVVLEKYPNAIDANIVKGALEASGIPAGVIVDSTANAIWMAPVRVVVFERDLELARKVISETNESDTETTED